VLGSVGNQLRVVMGDFYIKKKEEGDWCMHKNIVVLVYDYFFFFI
jgi:hypothetical protein